jgi:putative phosphoribosyl transferase
MAFANRAQAGEYLARSLQAYANRPDVTLLGLPRGGVPVAYEVARKLNVPMDIMLVRKLGVPGQEELAFGAVAAGGVRVLNEDIVDMLDIPDDIIDTIATREQAELERREEAYREGRTPASVNDRTVILIDDGLATGSTMRAAVQALRAQHPRRIVVAAPVGSAETCMRLEEVADEVVCAHTPEPFFSVGAWYEDFSQTSDDEVRTLLNQAAHEHAVG